MREILFRGKNLHTGEWQYGFYVGLHECGDSPTHAVRDEIHDETYRTIVDPETVGQFTGLLDKNGTKIFEGDVMDFEAYGFYMRGVVKYELTSFCIWCEKNLGNECSAAPFLDDAVKRHEAVVIGNIHENPELLEELH